MITRVQKFFKKIPRRISFLITQATLFLSYLRLAKIKGSQKSRFEALKNRCSRYYIYLSKKDISNFMTPIWGNYSQEIEKAILPSPHFSFLRNRIIRTTMFVTAGGKWINEELEFLEKSIPEERLTEILEEDYIGNPILINSEYLTSHNSIHQLYHLMKFQEKTKINLDRLESIIEWGGGYGNMAKILRRMLPGVTYIIIDLPAMSCLQWVYLATIFGEGSVNILPILQNKIEKGKINLLPISFLKDYELRTDLFIATWSLSER